jgi:hypothetical protein
MADQETDETRECSDEQHCWHPDADEDGDTCNCGAWYRFKDRIVQTPDREADR